MIDLTQDERNYIASILYQVVGGPAKGLHSTRYLSENIAAKLNAHPHAFDVKIEEVNRMRSQAVVVRRVNGVEGES